ncbi:hypothetical protein evm_005045 [Chilo suppressalis]|nr:hypothetical protein evm_005045 [Chilo suppressalis]
MMFLKYILYLFAILTLAETIKVDMQGSLVLGKDILDTIEFYFRRSASMNNRRSMAGQPDTIAIEVISSSLCRKTDFCSGILYQFINEYVIALAKVSESVFEDIHNIKVEEKLEAAAPLFGKLKGCLRGCRKIIKTANAKVNDENEAYVWVSVVKKISAEFQTKTITYIADKLGVDASDNAVKKVLIQKLVVGIAKTEAYYQKKLCLNYKICLKSLECTKSLNTLLERILSLPDTRVKSFIRSLYEYLQETSFYKRLNEVTANEFQVILNDMAYADSVPTKDILSTVKKIVATRINNIYNMEENVTVDQDIVLVQIILSDMDFFYSKIKSDPFEEPMNDFIEWTRTGGRVNSFMKGAIGNIENILYSVDEELIAKLTYEVRVFLEITVDPENEKNMG